VIAALLSTLLLNGAPEQRLVDIHDAHPVTGPERLPGEESSSPWIWIAPGSVGIAILILLVRRRQRQPVPEPAAHDWALDRLSRLSGRNGDGRATVAELAAIIRGYLQRKYGVVESLTTQELAGLDQAAAELGAWSLLLEQCDLTKFAQIEMTPAETAETIRRAQTLLTATLPISEGPPPTKTGELR
jgi:hypothetical protein